MISYDLRKVRNYDGLIKILRGWKCISPLKSLWLGTLTGPAGTIRDLLRAQMDSDDGLIVVELKPGADWALYKTNENAAAWLQANVTP
ncbi:hypothetical protein [Aminobacter aminovorans]|nr:hypothetical protein [Aminobacter aminovorans]